ncbi:MAG TPA: hypothetical protein VKQ06_02855 [Gammaproteobacteria bacterium]|nr:hypothetical protein [Gammaproteobacteria bacterium]
MSSIKSFGIALSGVAVLYCGSALAEMHATEEFESGATRPVTVAVLPAQVNLIKQRMIRREAQVDESGELEEHLADAVAAELVGKNYEVERVTAQRINADPDLQALVVEANRRYDELLGNISRRFRKQIEERDFHAGDTVTLLANRLGVDAIAFVRMDLVANAKAVQALNFGMGGTQTMMSVSLVDSTTTDVEAYITLPIMRRGKAFGGYDDIMNNPDEEMANYAAATLDDLIEADPSLRATTADESVLADLEDLLE